MKNVFFAHFLLLLTYSANASICQWSGPATGNWNNPANWSCGYVPGVGDTVKLSGNSIELNDLVEIQALIMLQNSTISGTGSLTVSGKIDLSSGGNHTFLPKIIANGAVEATMVTLNFNAQPFIVAGTAHFTQCQFWMNNGGTFEIDQTGVATFQNATNFYSFSPYYGFVVRGKIFKTGASNMDFEALYAFRKATVNIESGYLVNYYAQSPFNCIIDSSTINIASGAFLRTERTINISNSTINGPGSIWIGLGQCILKHPNTVWADIEQRGGSCLMTNGVDTLANYRLFAGSVSGVSQIKGNFDWNKGNTSSTSVQGFTHIFDTDAAATNQKMLNGSLTVLGGGKYTGNDQLSGSVNIPVNAVFSLDANPFANFKADLQVFGTLRKLNPDAVSVGFLVNSGRIEGIGKIDATVITQGTLAPGVDAGIGTISFNGPSLNILAQNKIEVQLSNIGNVISKDLLNLIGRCKLDGALIVLESGNVPPGDYVVVQASDSLTGSFAELNLPPFWEVIQNPFNITLRKLMAPPEAQFSVQIGSGCAPGSVSFFDAATGDSLTYSWSFPGGNPAVSTDKNPTVEYALAGDYSATLTVSNALGASSFSMAFSLYSGFEVNLHVSICAGDSIEFNGQYVSIPGVYSKTLQTVHGCDSLVNLQLSSLTVDFTVSQTDSSLTANAANAVFQWLNCADFSPIPGATSATFSPIISGNYAVLVTNDLCSTVSDCFSFSLVGTSNLAAEIARFRVYPNPATDFIQVIQQTNPGEINPDALLVYDLRGVQIGRFTQLNWENQTLRLDVRSLRPGPYFWVLEADGVRVGGVWVLIGA